MEIFNEQVLWNLKGTHSARVKSAMDFSDRLNLLHAGFMPTSMVSLAVMCLSTTVMYPMLVMLGHAYSIDLSSPLTFCGRWSLPGSDIWASIWPGCMWRVSLLEQAQARLWQQEVS